MTFLGTWSAEADFTCLILFFPNVALTVAESADIFAPNAFPISNI